MRRQLRQQLGAQVAGEHPVGAAERARRLGRRPAAAQRLRGDRQRARPAARARGEQVDGGAVEAQPGARQQQRRLEPRHRQLAGAEHEREPVGAQPRDRRAEPAPRGERERRARGQVAGGVGELGDRGRWQQLRVVDRDHDRAAGGVAGEQARGRARRLERVGAQPGERPPVAPAPLGEQRRLAVAGRRGDRHQRQVGRRGERAQQARPRHEAGRHARRAGVERLAVERLEPGAAGWWSSRASSLPTDRCPAPPRGRGCTPPPGRRAHTTRRGVDFIRSGDAAPSRRA